MKYFLAPLKLWHVFGLLNINIQPILLYNICKPFQRSYFSNIISSASHCIFLDQLLRVILLIKERGWVLTWQRVGLSSSDGEPSRAAWYAPTFEP